MTQNDEINHIVVDDGIMTSFITINSTTASPKGVIDLRNWFWILSRNRFQIQRTNRLR